MKLEILDNGVASGVSRCPHRLLFVHGAAAGAWIWDDVLSWFASEGIAASALSLRGHGASEGRERLDEFGIADYVADVNSALSALDRPAILIGHSMGGLVVQKLLETRNLAGAVLLASSPVGGLLLDGLRMTARWPGRFTAALLRRSIFEIYATEQSTHWLLFAPGSDPALARDARRRLGPESWRAIQDMMGLVRPQPARVNTPILVLAGADDNTVAPGSNLRTARAYDADIEFFEDCGHMMMLERVWPQVAAAIRDWCLKLMG